ncbi:hypothetical protein GUJ93_ZPchr0007g4361 [Zizania palustris]|uniref:Uncharacterized protein n=1 Tax=Zizania palustris TaxID=103762 RepID=A0A8J5T1E5_ZIZPA|nr:hypothetical protein GUJ93_ZPchr0007g4361 [Zizania palustris]
MRRPGTRGHRHGPTGHCTVGRGQWEQRGSGSPGLPRATRALPRPTSSATAARPQWPPAAAASRAACPARHSRPPLLAPGHLVLATPATMSLAAEERAGEVIGV